MRVFMPAKVVRLRVSFATFAAAMGLHVGVAKHVLVQFFLRSKSTAALLTTEWPFTSMPSFVNDELRWPLADDSALIAFVKLLSRAVSRSGFFQDSNALLKISIPHSLHK